MDYKEKLITQTVVCCMLFVSAKGLEFLPGQNAEAIRTAAMKQIERNYTAKEWKQFGGRILETVKEAPAAVANTVMQANQDETKVPVYAAFTGVVQRSGIDPQHGMTIEIRSKDRAAVTGNLCSICLVEKEHVKKGDLIGYYDRTCGKELYHAVTDVTEPQGRAETFA